jgi:tetratricopeptide (TPR) repeat protein
VQLKQGFIWLAMQSGEYERLGKWLHDEARTPNERDFVLVALGQHLQAGVGAIEPELIEALFPDGVRLRLWQTAALFGSRGHFREAVQLGQRLFDGLKAQRSAYGVELAHWYLYLGEVAAAQKVLRASLDAPGESLDSPTFTALREYYALLPEAERPAFAATYRESLDASPHPLHRALGGVVLHGLTGEFRAAWTELKQVLDLGAMTAQEGEELGESASRDAAGRHWDFILASGLQLQAWKMDELAVALWEQALGDSALIVLQSGAQGDRVLSRSAEVRLRLAALKIARATSADAAVLVDEYARGISRDALMPLAEALETIGAFPRAIALHRRIWEQEPADPHSVRNLLTACRTGNDLATLQEVLSRCVREGLFRSNEAAHRDLALQYLDVLEKEEKLVDAQKIAGEIVEAAPADARFLQRLAQLQERSGQTALAEATYRRLLTVEQGHVAGRVALATLLEKSGKLPAAIEVLEPSSGPEIDAKLALLYLHADRLDDAFEALERIPATAQVAPTLLFVDALVAKGESREARAAVQQAVARSAEVRVSFPLQSRLIELLPADGKPEAAWRELRRLRALAGDAAEFIAGYYDLLLVQAPRLKLEQECTRALKAEWADGDGLPAAGVTLAEWQFANNEAAAAEATVAGVLSRPDASEAVMIYRGGG